jgi:AraC-like DNA-binding protein
MSFGEWRQQLRLSIAIDMMGRGESISKIAVRLGYSNLASFTVMFKQALGVPPSRFHKSQVGSIEKSSKQ